MSDLAKHNNATMVPVSEEPAGALAVRSDASLVPSPPLSATATPKATASKGPGRLAVAVIAASIVAAVAVGAAAFSGGSSASGSSPSAAGSAHGSLATSASDSAAASSVAFSMTATETTPSTTTNLLSGHGSVDLAKGVGRVTASIPGLSGLVGSGARGSVDIISDGTNVYLNVPGVSSLTGGKGWVKTSLSGLSSLTGSSAGSLSLSTLADPAHALGLLGSLGSTVTKVGTVTLNGEQTTEYQTTVSVADIVSQLSHGSPSSASSGAAAKALQQLGIPSVPVNAWVGRDGLLRQLSVTIDLSHASLGSVLGSLGSTSSAPPAGAKVNLTIGLSHYGEPVSVSVPPASDVTDLNSIASSLKGMASQLGGALSGMASHV